MAVEVAQDLPDGVDRRVDDRGARDLDHRVGPGAVGALRSVIGARSAQHLLEVVERGLEDALADVFGQLLAPCPAALSNSADHSAKVRLPSVTGVSLRVAT